MAKAGELTVDVKLDASEETVRACVALLNMYLKGSVMKAVIEETEDGNTNDTSVRKEATMKKQTVNILGTEYAIETHKISEDETMKSNQWCGYCDEEQKLIVVADMTEKKFVNIHSEEAQEKFRKKTLRHEITHAFFNESGLSDDSSISSHAWAKNEEMVDWFAIQSPKIFKVFQELDIL